MAEHHWPPGRPAWIGAYCLVPEVVQVDTGPTHRTRCVATYDHATSTSRCPECGAVVAWSAEPSQWADPRCRECQAADSCPATLRTGGAVTPITVAIMDGTSDLRAALGRLER